jgi:hypothetical protein
MVIVAEPTPVIDTYEVSKIDAILVLLLENEKTLAAAGAAVSVFVDDGARLNDASPYVFVIEASVITGVSLLTTSLAVMLTSACSAVAACVALICVSPALRIVTVRPATPPIDAIVVSPTIENVNGSLL